MAYSTITQQIIKHLDQFPPDLQRRVLDFVQALALSRPKGTSGKQLLRFFGVVEPEDAQAMMQAIEGGCERVDADGW